MLGIDHIVAVLLSGTAPASTRQHALRAVRRHAEQRLHAACGRVGISVNDLADNDRAVVASLLFRKAEIERSERAAALLVRWCVEGEERGCDPSITTRIVQALRDMEVAVDGEGQHKAREASKAARRTQAETDATQVAELFAAAWRAGMGRVGLQAAAAAELRERERRLTERLITVQQAGNKPEQRRISAALQAVARQSVLCTLHRAGKWLQQRHGGP